MIIKALPEKSGYATYNLITLLLSARGNTVRYYFFLLLLGLSA
jgi:hypothetical protein